MKIINGQQVAEPIPNWANKCSGPLIILGSGENVWTEFEEARGILDEAQIMCVNMTFMGLDSLYLKGMIKVHHWVSVHKEFFQCFSNYATREVKTHCPFPGDNIDFVWNGVPSDGTSCMFAVRVARLLGYNKILLCGVPLKGRRFYDHPATPDGYDYLSIHLTWRMFLEHHAELQRAVRSMSGYTKELFGGPKEVFDYPWGL